METELLASAFESLDAGIAVLDREGRVRFANRALAALLGTSPAQLAGSAWTDVEPGPSAAGATRPATLHRRDGSLVEVMLRSRAMPGAGGLRSLHCEPLSDADAAPAVSRTTAEALRRSEEQYRAVVDNVGEGIVVAQGGRIVFANPMAARMSDRTVEELLTLGVQDVIHPEDLPGIVARDQRRLRGEGGERYTTYRALRRDGSWFWVQSAPVTIDWGGSPATLTFLIDLSERRAAEDALRRSEERYRLVVEHVEEGIIVVQDGVLKLCNPATEKMTGYARAEIEGQSMTAFIHPEDMPKVLTNYQARLRGEPQGERYDFRILTKDGRTVWVELGAVLVEWEQRPATLSFLIDVTERKQAEAETRIAWERQQELNYLKTRFLSMTSHEFRTPLATILSSTELLRYYGERLPAEEKAELFDTVETAVKRMTRLLEDVLVIGKQDSGAERLVTSAVDVAQYCRTLLEEVRLAEESQGRGGRRIAFEAAEGCGFAQIDEAQLRHVLVNLLSNAIKYTPEGARVSLEVRPEGDWLRFEITDEGIGIAAEDMSHLFDLFFRARNVGNTPGTGLGLAIARRAAELHGGTIAVDSELGRGTRFTVRIPRGDTPDA